MPYCNKCGAELYPGSAFCNECGQPYVPNTSKVVVRISSSERGPWKVFAIIGFVLGIVALAFSVIPFCGLVGFGIGIDGLIFSILGKKSLYKSGKATAGLTMSIFAMVLGLVLYISCVACIASEIADEVNNGYYYYTLLFR